MQVPVYNLNGEEVEKIEISQSVFGVPFNQAVVHQVMVAQRANARQGTASTKTRGQVMASTRKLFRQKGTGLARAGAAGSPLRRGGGITFGPKPRNYRQAVPKKMRRLALKCVLSAKVSDEDLIVLEQMQLDKPRTREMVRILGAVGVNSSVLVVTAEPEENVVKSARNIPGVKIMPASLLNIIDILSRKRLLMTVAAVRKVERLWGERLSEEGSGESLRDIATPVDN